MQGRKQSIKGFLLCTAMLFSALGFLLIYLAVTQAYRDAVKANTTEASRQIAISTFTGLYPLIRQGWPRDQIDTFLTDLHINNGLSYEINILRAPIVSQEFHQPIVTFSDPLHQASLDTGQPQAQFDQQNQLRYNWPILANEDCLLCHHLAKPGDLLGIIEIKHNSSALIASADNKLLSNLILLSPLPFSLALLVVFLLNRRINRSIGNLEKNIEGIERVSDLSNMRLQAPDQGFTELDNIYSKVETLATKMRTIAVDKEQLEFQIQLLEKFVITSEVVNDWQNHISKLLAEINQVIPTHCLFSMFQIDDEICSLDIFWLRSPHQQCKALIEAKILNALVNTPLLKSSGIPKINHHIKHPDAAPIDITNDMFSIETKQLSLIKPNIAGVVGIGIHPETMPDHTRHLFTSSILSTLLNLVGSVKSIYAYTKDLEYYATRDPLTDLHNQRTFWELLNYEVVQANRLQYKFCVMVLDLDDFKSINDTYGHSFGDRCLQGISAIIRSGLRPKDLLARYGGDEFALILPHSDLLQAQDVAKRIIHNLRENDILTPDGKALDTGMSIGISVYPDHADTSKDLFMFADNMMYRAKNQGKNRISVPSEKDVLKVFNDLNEKTLMASKAIAEQRIIPYFQPIVATDTNEIKAIEVLCRILTDDGHLVSASEFIEIAEKQDIIGNLDFITIEKALAQVIKENYQGQIFINVSPRSIEHNNFIDEINHIVDSAAIEHQRLVFEISERDTVKSMNLLEQFILTLKKEGYMLAVDDFGSGLSSFHYLKHFPIDFVKIDGEFIANILSNPKDQAVVRCISNLAQELQAKAIAEYVENQEVLDAVKAIGIPYAQGFYIRKPTPYILNPAQALHIIPTGTD